MPMSRKSAFAAGAVAAVVIGSGTAVAANGQSLLIGRSNAGTAATTLTNSTGTPLALNAKAGTAPLAVNSNIRVPNLNADRLDGLEGSHFLRSTGKAVDADKVDGVDSAAIARVGGQTGMIWGSERDKDGAVDTAACPAGTKLVSGGGFALDETAAIVYDGPDYTATGAIIPNSWYVETTSDTDPAWAFVTCYNPLGAVPGAAKALPLPVGPAAAARGAASSKNR